MDIDWITVSAQIVNFLILVWLLKRFLYQPVINAMDQREQGIQSRRLDAERLSEEATARVRDYEKKIAGLDREKELLLEAAKREVGETKRQLLDEVRQEVSQARHQWQQQTELEKEEFLSELRRRAAETAATVTSQMLREFADTELEDRMIGTFIKRLDTESDEVLEALASAEAPLMVSSAYPLDAAGRERIVHAIRSRLPKADVQFAEAPDLVCGIEISSNGRAVGWNLAEYIDSLAEKVDTAFADRVAP